MALIVHGYGGTSTGSVERIKNVTKRITKWYYAGYQIMVVPSATSGKTNHPLGMAKETSAQPSPRELDMIVSTGEQVSADLLAIALHAEGVDARSYTGWQVPVKTDFAYTKARIQSIGDERVRANFGAGHVVVITGFQGINSEGHITTLGRGGSNTSAVAVAAALETGECLIHTGADSVYTTDPRMMDDARRLDKITFGEMLKMASPGSKVLQVRSVGFAGKYRVKTRVPPSLADPLMPLDAEMNSSTLIIFKEDSNVKAAAISDIAFTRNEAKIIVIDVPNKPGVTCQILGPVADANIGVNMIIQSRPVERETDFTFAVPHGECQRALTILNDSVKAHIDAASVSDDPKVSRMSMMGVGIRSHVGIAGKVFRMLSEEGINIQMIFTSEIKISVLVDEKCMGLAVRALHKAFELDQA